MSKRAKPNKRNNPFNPYRLQDVPLFMDQAVALHQRGKVDEAFAIYRRVLSTVPNHADALHFMGMAEHQRGNSEKALELMGRSIALVPEHPDFYNNRGNVQKQLGKLSAAEADYREVLRLVPGDPKAMNNLGVVLRERGEHQASLDCFRQAIAADENHADAYLNLGNALAHDERFDEALASHRKALELRPEDAKTFRYMAGMCYATGRIGEATALYRAWLDAHPGDPVATHMLKACTQAEVPERASSEYVTTTFDDFAASFDYALERLGYRAPSLVGGACAKVLGDQEPRFRIVDLGCGTGLCGTLLRPYAQTLVGVDLSAKMLERARARKLYDRLLKGDLETYLRQLSGTEDVLVSADTLVYFGALESVCAAAAQALAPGGRFIFTVERATGGEAQPGYRIHPHGRYSHQEDYVRRCLEGAGLEVASLEPEILRKEAGKWVDGLLVTASKPV